MMWGRTPEPSKEAAKRFARYAFEGYLNGVEKGYMVEAAITDLEAAYGKLEAAQWAREALSEADEGQREILMRKALAWVESKH